MIASIIAWWKEWRKKAEYQPSELLAQFYRDIQQWIDAGTPADSYFNACRGLCSNLHSWCVEKQVGDLAEDTLAWELADSFERANLNQTYPFDDSMASFMRETWDRTMYHNAKRLAWVKKYANNQEDE